jgi:hypothetical protein
MNLKAFILFLLVCFVHTALTQTDLEGWRQSKWGMTADQVIKAFNGEVVRLKKPDVFKDGHAPVGIESYALAGHKYKVSFVVNEKGKLHKVSLDLQEEGNESIFESLEKLLTEKYGKPSYQNNRRNDGNLAQSLSRETMWSFSKTTITLTYYELIASSSMHVVLLTYKAKNKELDKL